MAYVVTEKCIDCKYTTCVDLCPVEAFHEGPDRLLINPDTCVDCDACVRECPVGAIYQDEELPEEYQEWLAINKEAEKYPIISASKDPLLGPKCVEAKAG